MKRMAKVTGVWLCCQILSTILFAISIPPTGHFDAADPRWPLTLAALVIGVPATLAIPVLIVAWLIVIVRWLTGGKPKPTTAIGFTQPPPGPLIRYKLVDGKYVRDDP